MPRRENEQRNVRKLARTGFEGRSISVTLPADLIDELDWREKQKVVVEKWGDGLLIRDWKEKK